MSEKSDGNDRPQWWIGQRSPSMADTGTEPSSPAEPAEGGLSRVLTLASALAMAAKWFREYEARHVEKGDTAKAARNRERAGFCEAAIRAAAPGEQRPAEGRRIEGWADPMPMDGRRAFWFDEDDEPHASDAVRATLILASPVDATRHTPAPTPSEPNVQPPGGQP